MDKVVIKILNEDKAVKLFNEENTCIVRLKLNDKVYNQINKLNSLFKLCKAICTSNKYIIYNGEQLISESDNILTVVYKVVDASQQPKEDDLCVDKKTIDKKVKLDTRLCGVEIAVNLKELNELAGKSYPREIDWETLEKCIDYLNNQFL